MDKAKLETVEIVRSFSAIGSDSVTAADENTQRLIEALRNEIMDELKQYLQDLLNQVSGDLTSSLAIDMSNLVNNTVNNNIRNTSIGKTYKSGYGINIEGNTIHTYLDYDSGLYYTDEASTGKKMIAVNIDTDDFQFNGSTGALELKASSGTSVRRAKIQTSGVGTTTLTCKLLDSSGSETGDAITVYPVEHLGTNALSGNVWPKLAATDIVSVFLDVNGNYYTTFIFDDTDSCA